MARSHADWVAREGDGPDGGRGPGTRALLGIGILLAGFAGAGPTGCGARSGEKPELVFGQTGLGEGDFSYPRTIAVAPDGRVFVIDKAARVQRFDPEGRFECAWRMPEWQLGKPTGLAVHPDGRLFIADTHYSRVMIYDRDGHLLDRFGTPGTGPGQFLLPTNVAIDGEGFIYVSEYGGNDRISKFAPDHSYVLSFGGPDAGQAALRRPQCMDFDREQTLWVADACNHRICRFSRDGRFLSSFGRGRGPRRALLSVRRARAAGRESDRGRIRQQPRAGVDARRSGRSGLGLGRAGAGATGGAVVSGDRPGGTGLCGGLGQ